MPFENFYKSRESEYDRVIRRWWVAVLAVAAVFIGFVFMPDREWFEPQQQQMQFATYNERQQRVDELCGSLPKPEAFYFVNKSFPAEDYGSVAVVHFFRTTRAPEEIYPQFILWFGANGWTDNKDRTKPLEFTKNNQTIMISPIANSDSYNFMINCTEWKVE